MAAPKKTIPKKTKAPVKNAAAVPVKRAPRKQAAAAPSVSIQESTLTLVLVSLFAVLSVLFAAMAYWRYHI
jgi:hypothetical protein